jgi:hypothetical protein
MAHAYQARRGPPQTIRILYKWREGTTVGDYADAAIQWGKYTEEPDFISRFTAHIQDTTCTNDARAAAVENFLLEEAIAAGVVQKVELTLPRNPNKWGKKLAPWFTEECREAKRALTQARRTYGRGHPHTIAAATAFRGACAKGRRVFAESVPNLMKYSPKQFWGMFHKSHEVETGISA